jgi:hypothetical protein
MHMRNYDIVGLLVHCPAYIYTMINFDSAYPKKTLI